MRRILLEYVVKSYVVIPSTGVAKLGQTARERGGGERSVWDKTRALNALIWRCANPVRNFTDALCFNITHFVTDVPFTPYAVALWGVLVCFQMSISDAQGYHARNKRPRIGNAVIYDNACTSCNSYVAIYRCWTLPSAIPLQQLHRSAEGFRASNLAGSYMYYFMVSQAWWNTYHTGLIIPPL